MFGASPKDDTERVYLPLFKFTPRRPVDVLCVSTLEGVYTHFDGKTRICPGAALCRLCAIGRSRRYQGFFACVHADNRYLVRLTAEAALRLVAHPPAPGAVLRVESVSLRRPLQIAKIGEVAIAAANVLSEKELIAVVMALHGLGVAGGSASADELRSLARERAQQLIDREALALS